MTELNEDTMMKIDGFDDAIRGVMMHDVGLGPLPVLVYQIQDILHTLRERDGMTFEEAFEFFEFNIEQAYVGPQSPVFISEYHGD